MRSIRLVGMVLAVSMWIGFHPNSTEAAPTFWSTNGAGCVPVGTSGIHVAAGAVTAGAGITVTLYCAINNVIHDKDFDAIEITYKGKGNVSKKIRTTAELIEMSKASGAEKVRCTIQGSGSATITTEAHGCDSRPISGVDFDNNFYYIRIILKSGIAIGQLQTIYGVSLIFTPIG